MGPMLTLGIDPDPAMTEPSAEPVFAVASRTRSNPFLAASAFHNGNRNEQGSPAGTGARARLTCSAWSKDKGGGNTSAGPLAYGSEGAWK